MAETLLPFKLITPTGVVFDGSVQEVTAVNSMGWFGFDATRSTRFN